jgi:segregation and condensation protein B
MSEEESPQPAAEAAATEAEESGVEESRLADSRDPSVEELATVEAILFSTDSPLNASRIAQAGELARSAVRGAIEQLNQRYEQMGCAFRIEQIAGGFQMLTLPQFHDVLARLLRSRSDSRLSQAALEALAIVAYRQPILRADMEAIRGVSCGEVLRGLMEKQLVKIVGRAEVPGRPMLYGTTRRFLEVFGLASLDELPRAQELREPAQPKSPPAPAADAETPSDDEAPEENASGAEQNAPAATDSAESPASERDAEETSSAEDR